METSQIRRLMDALEDGLLVREGDRLVRANSALEHMLGSAPGGLEGRRISELFCDADGRSLTELTGTHAVRLRAAQGDLVAATLQPLGDGNTFLVLDRSRESRLEDEIWRLTQELRQVHAGSQWQGPLGAEISGMIEHEIRTASTAVHGYLQLLLDKRAGDLNPTQRRFLEEAQRASGRISSLVDNLLEMTTPDAPGALCVVRKPTRLNVIVSAAVDAMRPLLEERNIDVELELDAKDDQLTGDAGRLEQVVLNLLGNAAKFGPQGSPVRVATYEIELDGGRWLCLSTQDEGPGVEDAEKEQIFQPFVRGQAASEANADGVGLGLAICRKIVEAHGGTIEAVPSPGQGLFRVLLPPGA